MTTSAPVLSVLDLAPIVEDAGAREALAGSTDLARHVERWGYRRYWVAEHHNMPGIASSAPAVLIAHLAAATERMRIGSGGVMLPNHPPLVVAEQFGTLEALHPGRIDLGIGRAPGTDPGTAAALRRSADPLSADDFPDQLGELIGYLTAGVSDGDQARRIRAVPTGEAMPEIWLLGSSGYSAQLAGYLGLPFAFAHHFSSGNTLPAVDLYRSSFRPSDVLREPYLMLGVSVLCAETDERALRLAAPARLSLLSLRQGRPRRLPTPEEAEAYAYTPAERAAVEEFSSSHVVGSPATVRAGLDRLVERTGADELMLTTMTYAHADRLRSYELVAAAYAA